MFIAYGLGSKLFVSALLHGKSTQQQKEYMYLIIVKSLLLLLLFIYWLLRPLPFQLQLNGSGSGGKSFVVLVVPGMEVNAAASLMKMTLFQYLPIICVHSNLGSKGKSQV